MPTRSGLLTLLAAVAIGHPLDAGGQTCPVTTTFDPNASTLVRSGGVFLPYGGVFSSPENSDHPHLIMLTGDPITLDGRLGGIAPGSDLPTGKIQIDVGYAVCLGLDVQTVSPYTTEIFDRLGVLVSSVTGSSPTVELPFWADTWTGYRVVLTPGSTWAGRDGLTVDNLRSDRGVVPVEASSWGRLKTIYR